MKLAAPDGPDGDARVLPPRCNPTPSMGLNKRLAPHGDPCHTRLRLGIPQCSEPVLDLGDEFKVAAADELLAKLEQVFGERVAVLR
jgi:hypothetical protein